MQRFKAVLLTSGLKDPEGAVAAEIGTTVETVRRYTLPRGHRRARRPDIVKMGAIERMFPGRITAGNFDDDIPLDFDNPQRAGAPLETAAARPPRDEAKEAAA